MAEQALCKGCGKPIIWAKTETGGAIPLDVRAQVYKVEDGGIAVKQIGTYVTHFATCSQANSFSRSKS